MLNKLSRKKNKTCATTYLNDTFSFTLLTISLVQFVLNYFAKTKLTQRLVPVII